MRVWWNNGRRIVTTNILGVKKYLHVVPHARPASWCILETGLGEAGIELIFKESIRINGKDAQV